MHFLFARVSLDCVSQESGSQAIFESVLALLSAAPTDLGPGQVTVRLLAASLLGLPLGLERESRDKPAGMRTHMLVSAAAAVFTLIALSMIGLAEDAASAVRIDPVRAIEAVVAGVAFLGAGTIIRSGGNVQGITTGASVWMVGGIGTACGVGLFVLAVLAAILGLIVLLALGRLEAHAKGETPD